jgi:hypothetical protein
MLAVNVIASEAKQFTALRRRTECFIARSSRVG